MAEHEFGIMAENPVRGVRYDHYEPWKYGCISIHDDYIEPLLAKLAEIDFFDPAFFYGGYPCRLGSSGNFGTAPGAACQS